MQFSSKCIGCYIYIQTVKLEFTRRFSFANLFAFVCELVCIHMWIFETLLTWLDSQMHFFQQGTLCSQSDASLVFSQSHDCSDWVLDCRCRLLLWRHRQSQNPFETRWKKCVVQNVTQLLLPRLPVMYNDSKTPCYFS